MDLLCQGIIMGLALTMLVGPILFALIQTSLDRGIGAGLIVGLGIWISDVLFIGAIFTGFAYIENVIKLPDFKFYGGLIGGVILLAIGIGMILSNKMDPPIKSETVRKKTKAGAGLFLKGFLINTVNPFTVFFWTGVVSNGLGYDEFTFETVGIFFVGLIGTIILTDSLKVLLAARIGNMLNSRMILTLRKISGALLVIFGLFLMLRVSVDIGI